MQIEVCTNGCQRNGCEVGSSDFFADMTDALQFARERLQDMEGGDWLYGCVTVYGTDGRVVDSFAANCNS